MEKRKATVFIDSSKAFQIALGDSETIYFIKTNFSHPEKNPEIFSQKWISKTNGGYSWNVAIIEKTKLVYTRKKEVLNVALIEVDSENGRIIRRHYLKNILFSEYRSYIRLIKSRK